MLKTDVSIFWNDITLDRTDTNCELESNDIPPIGEAVQQSAVSVAEWAIVGATHPAISPSREKISVASCFRSASISAKGRGGV